MTLLINAGLQPGLIRRDASPRLMTDFRSAVEEVFRRESGRIIAGLIRISQSFDLAEEAMQDALASALVDWQRNGLPVNRGA